MRRLIAFTLAGAAALLVVFTAYVWVGNWFTARTASGSALFGSGSCLSNGESFNYVVHVAIGAVQSSAGGGPRVEIMAESMKVRRSPSLSNADAAGAESPGCVIRKSDWPDVTAFLADSPLEGTALTPLGQTLQIRDFDTEHWQISASRGRFPVEVRRQ